MRIYQVLFFIFTIIIVCYGQSKKILLIDTLNIDFNFNPYITTKNGYYCRKSILSYEPNTISINRNKFPNYCSEIVIQNNDTFILHIPINKLYDEILITLNNSVDTLIINNIIEYKRNTDDTLIIKRDFFVKKQDSVALKYTKIKKIYNHVNVNKHNRTVYFLIMNGKKYTINLIQCNPISIVEKYTIPTKIIGLFNSRRRFQILTKVRIHPYYIGVIEF